MLHKTSRVDGSQHKFKNKGDVMKPITKSDWEAYRTVQDSGLYNMMSPDAIRASGLDIDTYRAIQSDYDNLYEKFEGADDE